LIYGLFLKMFHYSWEECALILLDKMLYRYISGQVCVQDRYCSPSFTSLMLWMFPLHWKWSFKDLTCS
jgi:hypothetical protein